MGFEVITAVYARISVFWDVTLWVVSDISKEYSAFILKEYSTFILKEYSAFILKSQAVQDEFFLDCF
jgi:hypothetical protein